MAKKNRNNKKPQNQPQSAPKPEVKAEVTVADYNTAINRAYAEQIQQKMDTTNAAD